ncbi:MAG: DUF4037 domain-containing protein [Treponema sp.]|jgi:hypothetical protein|nr:DUF4037 domain-containing protein [Treponema sp.]
MKNKTRRLAERFVSLLSRWPGVECVALNEAADSDTLDPYFAVILDVYYRGDIPAPEERYEMYGGDAGAFESSGGGSKDRFLVGGLPVRLEFKAAGKIEELVDIAGSKHESLWLLKDSGTYGYYRLAHGEILFSRTEWMAGLRRRLAALDDRFWKQSRAAAESKMEHSLSDLGAALMHNDQFHYLVSSALFIKYACLALFCVNRRFEPSHRAYHKQVLELPVLSESFAAELDIFLRGSEELTMERKYAVAQLLARKIIAL